jgi:glutathione synthase/RimK-type ligase-like ATP-grasp enzyme
MKTLVISYDTDDWKNRIPYQTKSAYSGRQRRAHIISLTKIAKKHNIRLTRASSLWYKKAIFKKAWWYDNAWKKIRNVKPDMVYDKTPLNENMLRVKKRLAKETKVFNSLFVEKLCSDKMMTYRYFGRFMPRCFIVNNKKQLKQALKKIRTKRYVLKPRAGSGAKGIRFFSKKKFAKMVGKDTIVQEFIDCSGVPGIVKGTSDLRIVTINGNIALVTVRKAKTGLVSNVSRGGKELVVDIGKISEKVKQTVRIIDSILKKYKPRIYTADFVFDRHNNPWLMELNSKPGLFGYEKYPKERKRMETALILAVKEEI